MKSSVVSYFGSGLNLFFSRSSQDIKSIFIRTNTFAGNPSIYPETNRCPNSDYTEKVCSNSDYTETVCPNSDYTEQCAQIVTTPRQCAQIVTTPRQGAQIVTTLRQCTQIIENQSLLILDYILMRM